MTLLIASRIVEGESVIELHGWLSGLEIAEFRGACAATSVPLRIHLENLAGASADGILALREQQARGGRLSGASPYIRLLLGGRPDGDGKKGAGPGTGT